MIRHLIAIYCISSTCCGLGAAADTTLAPPNPTPEAACKQAVVSAYEQLGKQAAILAQQPGPAVYRLLSETRFQAPGKKQESTVARTVIMAMQQGNSYYTDGTNEVYSSAKERVIIDRQKKSILVIDNRGAAADDSFLKSMQLIRNQLLAEAKVSACSSLTLHGKAYKKVVLTLSPAVQARTRTTTLTSLLASDNTLYQSRMDFIPTESVHQVSFTVLPVVGAAAAIRSVAPPLSYIYRPDRTLQPEFAQYHLTDQRKQAR